MINRIKVSIKQFFFGKDIPTELIENKDPTYTYDGKHFEYLYDIEDYIQETYGEQICVTHLELNTEIRVCGCSYSERVECSQSI